MILADDFGQGGRPQPVGEGAAGDGFGRWLGGAEEVVGCGHVGRLAGFGDVGQGGIRWRWVSRMTLNMLSELSRSNACCPSSF